MGVTVKVNDLTVSHQGSGGFVRNTLPDVCKTPSPGGPVPIPYPVIASFSRDLTDGSKTVTADGGNMISIKGSQYSRCSGDEAGTAGGVKSSTNMKEAKWLLYSFDVKIDGANACRLTDKMTMNHENTVSLGGDFEVEILAAALKTVAQACDKAVDKQWDQDHPNGPKHDDCRASSGEQMWDSKSRQMVPKPVQVKLGELKEQCVNSMVPDTDQLKKQQAFDANGTPCDGPRRGGAIPDIMIHGPGGVTDPIAILDLKFPCPSGAGKQGQWRPGQLEKYQEMFKVPCHLVFP
jgi:hypothetical protein